MTRSKEQALTSIQKDYLNAGICPDCGYRGLIIGPRGGLSRDVLCRACLMEFCIGLQPVRLGKCDSKRAREFFGMNDDPRLKERERIGEKQK